eukprot:2157851-Prymnesium_polylepis.1
MECHGTSRGNQSQASERHCNRRRARCGSVAKQGGEQGAGDRGQNRQKRASNSWRVRSALRISSGRGRAVRGA